MTSDHDAADAADAVVTLRNETRRFGALTAVNDLSLSVPAGRILGVIGPSGPGKTTAVRMATGTLEPTAGQIRVLGEVPTSFSRRVREQIAYMPQLFSLYEDLTASENVSFVAALFGSYWWRRGAMVRRALEIGDLWPARRRLARDLSGGMQRRLELACALVHGPTVLFLHEPTGGIDPVLCQSIWSSLRDLGDEGRTLLVTTQYVVDAEYCDRVALLAEGRLVALDEPETLRRSAFGGDVLRVEPAVFALVLQHLAVTLTALSMVRERLDGQMDLFRVSPLNPGELLAGKYFAYAVLSLVISAIVAALRVGLLG